MTPAPLPNGYYQLPRGKLANAVIWFETRPAPTESQPGPYGLETIGPDAAARYLALYRLVGRPWLWTGPPERRDAELPALLARNDVAAFVAVESGRDWGILELAFDGATAEIVYFGVAPGETGSGRGRWLMGQAFGVAARRGVERLWLHTCSFDDPGAPAFYRAMGFTAYAQGFEIMDDPRLTGDAPAESAPHVPYLPPARNAPAS